MRAPQGTHLLQHPTCSSAKGSSRRTLETPYLEVGFGGDHVENTFLITKTGCEPLQSMSLEMPQVG